VLRKELPLIRHSVQPLLPSQIIDYWIQDVAVGNECIQTLEELQGWLRDH